MRMWEIREEYEHDRGYDEKDGYRKGRNRSGMRQEKTMEEVYECGYEDGYEAAMEEMEKKYKLGHRRY